MDNCWRQTSSSSSWSDLYPEIILLISQNLKTRSDILSFRRVCKTWRHHSVPLSPNILSPILPHRFITDFNSLSPAHYRTDVELDLVVKSIYLITPIVVDNIESEASSPTSVASWIVMATELEPGKIQLRYPLNGDEIEHLPVSLDLTKFQVSELAKSYELKDSGSVRKVVLCSSSDSPALSDCTVIVFCHGGLGVLKLSGGGDLRGFAEWSKPRGDIDLQNLDDFVSFKGIYVAVDYHGRLFSVECVAEDSRPLVVTGILAADVICHYECRKKQLVVDPLSDKLYLVVMEKKPLIGFEVYEYNEECKKWDKVVAFCHDRVLFVGASHCFLAPDPVGCLGNCIVFVAESFPQYRDGYGPRRDLRLFRNPDLKDRIGVYHLGKRRKKFRYISDYPGLLQIMEPPPACFSSSEW